MTTVVEPTTIPVVHDEPPFPLPRWSSRRNVMQRNGRLALIDMTVMAIDGPTAARFFRQRAADAWAAYGPKDTFDHGSAPRRGRRKKGGEE